jgi:hypothetical protein
MGWFGRKSAEVVPAGSAMPLSFGRSDGEAFPRSYRERFSEVYLNNPVGQRALRLVAGATASLPLYLLEGKKRTLELIEQPGLIEGVTAQMLLHGNAFVQCVAGSRGVVQRLRLQSAVDPATNIAVHERTCLGRLHSVQRRPALRDYAFRYARLEQLQLVTQRQSFFKLERLESAGWIWKAPIHPPRGTPGARRLFLHV